MTDRPTPEPGDEFGDLNRRLIGVSRDLEIARQRLDVLEDNLEATRNDLRAREQRLSQLTTENIELQSKLEATERRAQEREQQLSELRERVSELLETNEDLRQHVEATDQAPPHVSVEEVLTQFMTLRQFSPPRMEGVEGREGPRVVLDSMDVELKGGISVREGQVHLSQIPGQELGPESASTLRFTLRTVPRITLITGDEEEE